MWDHAKAWELLVLVLQDFPPEEGREFGILCLNAENQTRNTSRPQNLEGQTPPNN